MMKIYPIIYIDGEWAKVASINTQCEMMDVTCRGDTYRTYHQSLNIDIEIGVYGAVPQDSNVIVEFQDKRLLMKTHKMIDETFFKLTGTFPRNLTEAEMAERKNLFAKPSKIAKPSKNDYDYDYDYD